MSTQSPYGYSPVRKGADGRWHGWLDVGTDSLTGRRQRKHVAHESPQVAQKRLDVLRRQLLLRGPEFFGISKPKTVAGWLTRWLAEEVRWMRSPFVRAQHRQYVDDWVMPFLGSSRLSRLSSEEVAAFLERLPALREKRDCLATLRLALGHAEERGYVDVNVADELVVEPGLPPWQREPDDPEDDRPFDSGRVSRVSELAPEHWDCRART